MNFTVKFLSAIAISALAFGCSSSDDNDDDLLLGLALLNNQRPVPLFSEVTPGFSLRDGEKAFYNAGPWGEAETKIDVPGLERETAFDVSIVLTENDGYAYFTANAGRDLRIQDSLAMMRLEQGGIREVLVAKGTTTTGNLPAGDNSKPTNSANFALTKGEKKDFCLEIHRKFKGEANPYEVEGHLIAWNKSCGSLTDTDRASYVWDVEGEIITGINNTDTTLTTGIASATGVGYVTKNAIVNVKPYTKKFGTAGSFR